MPVCVCNPFFLLLFVFFCFSNVLLLQFTNVASKICQLQKIRKWHWFRFSRFQLISSVSSVFNHFPPFPSVFSHLSRFQTSSIACNGFQQFKFSLNPFSTIFSNPQPIQPFSADFNHFYHFQSFSPFSTVFSPF